MNDNIDIHISEQPLEQQDCFDFVSDDSVGGICVFVGTVRNHTRKRPRACANAEWKLSAKNAAKTIKLLITPRPSFSAYVYPLCGARTPTLCPPLRSRRGVPYRRAASFGSTSDKLKLASG